MSTAGICRFHNLGNTCYMNSIFQILLHTPELTHILNTSKPHNISENRDEYDIIYYWKDMIKTVYSSNNILTITPRSLVQCIRKLSAKRLSVKFDNTQQDATEFLLFLMDVFHIALAHNVNIQISNQHVVTLANIECYKRIKTLYSNNTLSFNIYCIALTSLKLVLLISLLYISSRYFQNN